MERKNNNLIIIPKIEKYIEYMLTILLKLPRTEKLSQIIYFKEYIQHSIRILKEVYSFLENKLSK